MRKSTLLKVAGTFAAVMFSFGVMAQTHDGTAITGQANVAAYGQDATTYMVEGTTIPLYAKPDPIYHSAWNYTTATWTLTDGFLWNWARTGGANDTGLGTVTFSQNGVSDNYVQLSIDTDGQYEIQVTEEAPAAFGGCEGNPTTLIIQVVNTPAATLGGLAGTTENYCVGDPLIPATVPVTISGGWQNYRLVWSLEIATLGSGLAKDEWFDTDLTTSLGAALAYAENYTTAIPQEVAAAGAHEIMSVANFVAIDPDGAGPLTAKPTVYTYTLTSINDQALRFGQFIALNGDATVASAFNYNAIAQTYTIQINPAPNTGPIYHIPSTWAE